MTIKQNGGIFGRNPSYNDVTVNDLTATGVAATTVSTDDLSITDQSAISAPISAMPSLTKFQIGNLGTGSDATHSGRIKLDDQPGSLQSGGGIEFKTSTFGDGYGWKISSIDSGGVHLVIGTRANSADWTEVARFNSSGNLAFPSGQGIDFSATAGTGTSELFDDYEEGSWDMVLTSASGSFTTATIDPNATAYYTKIGRHVFIQGYFMTDAITVGTAAGDIYISLPFTAANLTGFGDGGTGAVGYAASWGGDVPSSVAPRGGDSKMNLHYRTSANGSVSNMQVGDLATGANSNVVVFTAMYIAA